MRATRFAAFAVTLAALMALLGCEPKQGDKLHGLTHIPASATVQLGPTSKQWMVELPEPLRRRFIEMIHSEATFKDFRRMTARPWGVFVVEGENFFWHGNAVVHSEPKRGRGWTSPVMQALTNRAWEENEPESPNSSSAAKWKALLDDLAKSTNLDSTPVEGFGRTPKSTARKLEQ